ncbi:MAG: hypothetical protein M1450_02200 [Patescibacteria group bacterium]|nr:hypothetical protein [Patescibacteria group bacterium]
MPVHMVETISRLGKARAGFKQELGRTPTDQEVADGLNWTKERVEEVTKYSRHADSLDRPVGQKMRRGDLIRCKHDLDRAGDVSMLRDHIAEALKDLPEKIKRVLVLRYGLEDGIFRTHDEVGQIMGFSYGRAQQLDSEGIALLKENKRVDIFRYFYDNE